MTWEREWRVQCDSIPLDPAKVALVVPYRLIVDSYKQECDMARPVSASVAYCMADLLSGAAGSRIAGHVTR